ncbi:hypothetical protein DDD63_11345 [Actinobaculum sp. 313]|nr:hypothetical protein DDD63_11345 [Actinobaculum sp. 313]
MRVVRVTVSSFRSTDQCNFTRACERREPEPNRPEHERAIHAYARTANGQLVNARTAVPARMSEMKITERFTYAWNGGVFLSGFRVVVARFTSVWNSAMLSESILCLHGAIHVRVE